MPTPTPTPSHQIESLTKSKATRAKRRSNPKHAKSNAPRPPNTNVCNLTTSCKFTMWFTIWVTDHHPSANRQWSRRPASQSNRKQAASTVSCRGVHAFDGASRRACVSCSGRRAHAKQREDVKAATGDGDYTAFVAASAAVAAAIIEPEQLPCSTLLPCPADTGGWATVATSFENHYVTHVTSAVKAIVKCIVLAVYPQAPCGLDRQRRPALIAVLVAGLQAADARARRRSSGWRTKCLRRMGLPWRPPRRWPTTACSCTRMSAVGGASCCT